MVSLEQDEGKLEAFARSVQLANSFVEVAITVCDHGTALFAVMATAVVWLSPNGRPIISVDNIGGLPDAHRRDYFTQLWATELFQRELRHMREKQAPYVYSAEESAPILRGFGYDGPGPALIVLPLVEPGGVLGFIRCGLVDPSQQRDDLSALATQVSVRLAQLGLRSTPEAGLLSSLSPRQFEVAQLASRGLTNLEIASRLDRSVDTIKKHLKDVFDRLHVTSRTELVALIARTAPREDAPAGITRRGQITITRAPVE